MVERDPDLLAAGEAEEVVAFFERHDPAIEQLDRGHALTAEDLAEIITGPLIMECLVPGTTARTNDGDVVYATDDQTLALTASNIKAIGEIVRWKSGTTCDVLFYAPDVSRGQPA